MKYCQVLADKVQDPALLQAARDAALGLMLDTVANASQTTTGQKIAW